MKKFQTLFRKPMGQVLVATVLFSFVYLAIFLGLYRAGTAYVLKERSQRASDMTVLSGGAVYANGLRLVRYSNVILMMFFAADIGAIGLKIAPLIPGLPEDLPLVLATAKKADPDRRKDWQEVQSLLFGVPLEDGPSTTLGAYPLLVELQSHASAADNQLRDNPALPMVFYNMETAGGLGPSLLPSMALRFRHAGELVPSSLSASYSLEHDGRRYFFTQDQVEPAENPRHPSQMRVRKDYPSPFAGMWVRNDRSGDDPSGGDFSDFSSHLPFGPSVAKTLKSFLDQILLDVTHRDDPPDHSLAMVNQLPGHAGQKNLTFTQINQVVLEGGGLAAWNAADPPFQCHLQKLDPTGLPGFGPWPNLQKAIDSGFEDPAKQLSFLGEMP